MRPQDSDSEFIRLYEAHYDEVLAYCARRTSSADAEEAAAEVFTVAWRRLDAIELETARGWLFGIARGVLANSWRSTKRRTRLVDRVRSLAPTSGDATGQQLLQRGEHDEVLAALHRLSKPDQEVLMLAVWEELSGPEIARALDVSVAAADQRLHRARKRLAKALTPTLSQRRTTPRLVQGQGEI
jgi:RNA polymerase sigma factor (sigma-70 family)